MIGISEVTHARLAAACEKCICEVLESCIPRLQKIITTHKLHRAAILSRAACAHCCDANAALLACDRHLSEKSFKMLQARVNMLEVISGVIRSYLADNATAVEYR